MMEEWQKKLDEKKWSSKEVADLWEKLEEKYQYHEILRQLELQSREEQLGSLSICCSDACVLAEECQMPPPRVSKCTERNGCKCNRYEYIVDARRVNPKAADVTLEEAAACSSKRGKRMDAITQGRRHYLTHLKEHPCTTKNLNSGSKMLAGHLCQRMAEGLTEGIQAD
jgi:hypothetical protein